MPNTREKLIELIERAKHSWSLSTMTPLDCTFESWIADHLIANGVTVQEWIPVTERLPENDSDVLAYQDRGEESRIVPANYGCGVWFDCLFDHEADNITHWMPLPQPPKGE